MISSSLPGSSESSLVRFVGRFPFSLPLFQISFDIFPSFRLTSCDVTNDRVEVEDEGAVISVDMRHIHGDRPAVRHLSEK